MNGELQKLIMKFLEKRAAQRRVMKKIVVLYHKNCTDGFGAAWAAWKKFGSKAEYVAVDHQALPPAGIIEKEVYMVDFTYPLAITQSLIEKNNRVTAIDHHVSSKEATLSTKDPFYAVNHSGAVLSWMYFHPGQKVPLLLRYVEDTDIWKFKLPHSRELWEYLDLFDFDFNIWDALVRDFERSSKRKEFVVKGEVLLRREERLIARLISNNKEKVRFAGFAAYSINSPLFSSQIGHQLAMLLPPIAIIWHRKDGVTYVSLRSDGTVDVSKLAAKFGGGGHKAAAAFAIKGNKKLPWTAIK